MTIQELQAYEVKEKREIGELNSTGYFLKHKKTGAKICVLSNEDENKVFYVGFRTPAPDDTGVPHILEHSVLCGSKEFPAKDPFVELAKGSLNTFLNAMTYPDKTVYPIASCNEKDFENLMHVYMDAVFYPNIYEREEIFRQEGWHYELENLDGDLTINGVVYNEMKGAFSSPEGVLERVILNSLYPDTTYANESGGDPDSIPELTYEEFLDFHGRYYHPSNSYIYLYGDCDMVERLTWLDEAYLSKFDYLEIDSEVKTQDAFAETVEVQKQYSISEGETEVDNTYLSYNKAVGTTLDDKIYLAMQIVEYVLLSAPGAPLKQALLDAKIGKDIMSSYDNGVKQPIFSIIAKNANVEQKEAFVTLIQDKLAQIIKDGMDKKALLAGINYFEFRYREADFGNYPPGLMYGLQAFDSWLYDENTVFLHLEALDTFEFLKAQVETNYYEEIAREYLLENTHASIVVIEPEKGLTAKVEQKVKEELATYKASLSQEELQNIIDFTKHLKEYQEEESTQEELEKIPMLSREDIGKEGPKFQNEELSIGNQIPLIYHELFTNGIGYVNLLFRANELPERLLPYLALLKEIVGKVDTKNYTFGEFSTELNMHTGGLSCGLGIYSNLEDRKKYLVTFEMRAKALYAQLPVAFRMIEEAIFTSNLENEKRLCEILAATKSKMQMALNNSGHSMSALRAMSYFSDTAYLGDLTGGVAYYEYLEEWEGNFEEKKEEIIESLKEVFQYIFRSENLMVSYTAQKEGLEVLRKEVETLEKELYKEEVEKATWDLKPEKKNEGFQTSSKIQYVACAGNFVKAGHAYTGALKVLRTIMSYDYLWNNIRVKGGAYGCMSSYTRGGDSYFVSYRDPNLEKTLEVYKNSVDYVKNFEISNRDMVKYIIGTISSMDTPLQPNAKGQRDMGAYLSHLTEEAAQKERDEVLGTNCEAIQSLAGHLEAMLAQNNICVIGNEEKIKEQKELFITTENLFH